MWQVESLRGAIDMMDFWRRLLRLASPAGEPSSVDAILQSVTAFIAQGRVDEAVAGYRRALVLAPGDGRICLNLGAVLSWMGNSEEALTLFERATQLIPQVSQGWYNLGNAHYRRGALAEAEVALWHALSLAGGAQDPAFVSSLIGAQALVLQGLGEIGRATEFLREAACHFPAHEDECRRLALLSLSGDPRAGGAQLLIQHLDWAERFADPLTLRAPKHVINPSKRPLRVGYVSGDLREHAVATFLEPILESHDRERFEIWCFDNSAQADSTTTRLKTLVRHWRSIRDLDDGTAEQQVRAAGIDVLVDLSGHTAGNRLGLFARRPAPVQITYLGYPATTGMLAFDFRITDDVTDPAPRADAYYREKLLRLVSAQWCYRPSAAARATPVGLAPDIQVRFGAFNRFDKVNDATLAVWGRVLASASGSTLFMRGVPEGSTRQAMSERLRRAGCDPQRVVLAGRVPQSDYWRSFHEADIALDTFPYNGVTTTCDALWMGLPVVTLAGSAGAARCAASLLNAAGLPELIAQDVDEYVAIAIQLASDSNRLAALHGNLRARVAASQLMDAARFTRGLEAAYLEAWERAGG